MKKCLTLLFAASSMLLFNACENEVFTPERVENTKDLVAPADFDWKTTQSQTYNLISKVNTVVSIYTDKDCTDESLLIENLVLNANEATDVSVNIPTYVTSIFVQYPTEDGKEVFEINTNGVTTRVWPGEGSFIQLPAEKDVVREGLLGDLREHYYYPQKRGQGTLMFEDLYPSKGDYDFNDYVIGYNVEIFKSPFIGIDWRKAAVGFIMKFQIRAIGGSLPFRPAIRLKGFAMENLKWANIEYESSTDGITIELLREGRSGKDDVIFFINGTESLCNGGYYNTVTGQINKNMPVVTCRVTRNGFGEENYYIAKQYEKLAKNLPDYFDFFIQNKETGDEIHFRGFSPTGIEGNKQSIDTEYKSKENLVWAIAVPQKISHPAEKEDIIKVYPKFNKWVTSGGEDCKYWYRNPQGSCIDLN
ncbi:LruC domain-containing protein [Bacteroides gallinarum]|uniref:LruC domain-containing protein n=1 Tax=Bacteroides gallinarum TaxID=376806 RepID=UPI000361EB8C|nr:LruC domain-containing protein [Bacteroides gallinarum]